MKYLQITILLLAIKCIVPFQCLISSPHAISMASSLTHLVISHFSSQILHSSQAFFQFFQFCFQQWFQLLFLWLKNDKEIKDCVQHTEETMRNAGLMTLPRSPDHPLSSVPVTWTQCKWADREQLHPMPQPPQMETPPSSPVQNTASHTPHLGEMLKHVISRLLLTRRFFPFPHLLLKNLSSFPAP